MNNKTAIYYPNLHQLEYWDSKNTKGFINCRNYNCAKLTILATEKLRGVKQLLIKQ